MSLEYSGLWRGLSSLESRESSRLFLTEPLDRLLACRLLACSPSFLEDQGILA
jgi:hypothetical protein